ncbi:MAG: acyl-ACP--UDP-N-acetylglucosamine O-acyltransferase [Chthoniobacterales bacterium]
MDIHPTAIIGEEVRLGKGCKIGPYSIIEGDVSLGENCTVQSRAFLKGKLRIGNNNLIGHGAIIGEEPQDFDFKASTQSEVIIGDNNTFREYVTIHRGTKEGTATTVGNHNFLMCGAHLGHNCTMGDHNVVANNCLFAGYVTVGNRNVFGGGSLYHQFITVSDMIMLRGGSIWGKDIPPYIIGSGTNTVRGLNSIGLRRNGLSAEARAEVKEAFRLIYHSDLLLKEALAESEKKDWLPEAAAFLDFFKRKTKRGFCQARTSGRQAEYRNE